MYGNRKDINRRLKRAFADGEKLAVLIWTEQDVMAQAEDVTVHEAGEILSAIGKVGMYDHLEEGVSCQTVQELLAGLRAGSRPVTLSADLLERVTQRAEHALLAAEAAAWEAGREGLATVRDGLADIARVRELLAA
ncbi:DUF1380 family protein [Pantoea agglomerans]